MPDTTTVYQQQVNDILARITIKSPTTYLLDDKMYYAYHQEAIYNFHGRINDFGSNALPKSHQQYEDLTNDIIALLYNRFYSGTKVENLNKTLPSKEAREAFMEELSEYNYSLKSLNRNWEVYQIDELGTAYAQKNGQLRKLEENAYVAHLGDTPLKVGHYVDFYCFREKRHVQPTFYHLFGEEYLSSSSHLMRIYWNISPTGVKLLIEQLTKLLNAYRIPFSFKCLNHPDLYIRRESGVLYFEKDNWSIVDKIVQRIIPKVRAYLKEEIPLFTKKITNGVGLAEDPGGGKSYGMRQCTALAEAMVSAYINELDGKKRTDFVKEFLYEKGIDIHKMPFGLNTHHYLLKM